MAPKKIVLGRLIFSWNGPFSGGELLNFGDVTWNDLEEILESVEWLGLDVFEIFRSLDLLEICALCVF